MNYQWGVIGAGPAGIAAVGKLIDAGVPATEICWIDPAYTVGDLGTKWRNIPSNTKVKLFTKFLSIVAAFQYEQHRNHFQLKDLDPEATCLLKYIADPLQSISDQLQRQVSCFKTTARSLNLKNRAWEITTDQQQVLATHNVILAVGAEPTTLAYPGIETVSLAAAMDREKIDEHFAEDDCVAVFGSSHSAMLVLQNLVNKKVKRIINFYRSPLRYAVYLPDWILFDDSGLKGTTAEWARQNINGKIPKSLTRVYSNQEHLESFLPLCNKVVYAVGFERRHLPIISHAGPTEYLQETGIIAPGLFGLGIAFPEAKLNPFGMLEYRVGLWKFMDYLDRILPIWMRYPA